MKKYMFELREGQEFILPILSREFGVEFTKVDETPKGEAHKYRRYGWHRRHSREAHPNKSYMVVGNYCRVFFDGPCEDAQSLKLATAARWDGIHGYWYARASEGTEKRLKNNGYTMIEQ